jgi:hypothetical protein
MCCRIVSIAAVPYEQESRPRVRSEPRAVHERLHAFSEHINAAIDVEDLISEVRIGEGHIGVAAERRQSILATDSAYAGAVRRSTTGSDRAEDLEREVPLPGCRTS